MNLTELIDVAAATVYYHCYILYYMNLTELGSCNTEYNNDQKLSQLLHELIQQGPCNTEYNNDKKL
jgi:hypothetical protein